MKIVCWSVLFAIISFQTFANSLPPVPDKCFVDQNYCYKSWVANDPEVGGKVIFIDFHGFFSRDDFPAPEDILPRYFDFSQWINYTSGSQDVNIITSEKWEPVVIDGQEHLRHFVHYKIRAPWPLEEAEIVDLSHYFQLPAYDGALVSWKFDLDHNFDRNRGVKHKAGYIHLAQYEGGHRVYISIAVVPEISILPEVALPYIEKAFLTIFKGMFDM
jgi:hypothetical protein